MFHKPGKGGAMLPRWLWSVLGVFFLVASATYALSLILRKQFDWDSVKALLSTIGLALFCFAFARGKRSVKLPKTLTPSS